MLVTIGKVVKPFGVKGEIKIQPMTDFPERFSRLRRVYVVSAEGHEITAEVRSVRYAGGFPFLLLEEFGSPEQAKKLNGWFVKIPEEEAVPLPEGKYYRFELIGMDVYSEGGEKLGAIVDIFETGSNDVYVMKRGRRETYIPAISDVVKQVDRVNKRMIVHLMEGLMD